MPKTHELKCHPNEFDAILRGDKTVEMRLNDRDYQTGDTLHLREYDPTVVPEPQTPKGLAPLPLPPGKLYGDPYTGRDVRLIVTHILYGDAFGVSEKWCAMSIRKDTYGIENIMPDNLPSLDDYECVSEAGHAAAKLSQSSPYGECKGHEPVSRPLLNEIIVKPSGKGDGAWELILNGKNFLYANAAAIPINNKNACEIVARGIVQHFGGTITEF